MIQGSQQNSDEKKFQPSKSPKLCNTKISNDFLTVPDLIILPALVTQCWILQKEKEPFDASGEICT